MITHAVSTGRLLSKNSRVQNVLYPGLLAVAAAYTRHASVVSMVACYVLLLLLYAVAVNLNNIFDLKTDVLNERSENMLVGQKLRRRHVLVFIIVSLIGIVALQYKLKQPETGILTAVYVVLTFVYSDSFFNLKSRGLIGTFVLCVCYSALPLLLGSTQGSGVMPRTVEEIAAFSALAATPLLLAKDYKDYHGDKQTHKITPLVQFGSRKLLVLVNCLLVFSVLTYSSMAYTKGISMYVMGAVVLGYVFLVRKLHADRGNPPRTYKLLLLFLLLVMPLTLLS